SQPKLETILSLLAGSEAAFSRSTSAIILESARREHAGCLQALGRRERVQVPPVCRLDAGPEGDPGRPTELVQPTHVEQLPRRSVRLGRVEADVAGISDHVAHQLRELADADV